MDWLAAGYAFWLGLFTAISPCPLATNIAAISFIARQVGNRRSVLASGLLYTVGRTATYVALGALLAAGLLAVADVSRFLQKYMNEILGPVMILLGMVLLGWIGSGLSVNLAGQRLQERRSERWYPLGGTTRHSVCVVLLPGIGRAVLRGPDSTHAQGGFAFPAACSLWCGNSRARVSICLTDRLFDRVFGQGIRSLDTGREVGPTGSGRAVRAGGRLLLPDAHLWAVAAGELTIQHHKTSGIHGMTHSALRLGLNAIDS